MKKLLLSLIIITGFASCKNDAGPIEKTGPVQLLPSVAAYNNNLNSDTSSTAAADVTPVRVSTPATKIIYITRPAPTPATAPQTPCQDVDPALPPPLRANSALLAARISFGGLP